MDRTALSALIRNTLTEYRYELPLSGSTIGIPWSAQKMNTYIEMLKAGLIEPYLERFELRETCDQITRQDPSYVEYWVVAEVSDYLEWYDPATGEFGLGQRSKGSTIPTSIGIRGDLVGVFCAM